MKKIGKREYHFTQDEVKKALRYYLEEFHEVVTDHEKTIYPERHALTLICVWEEEG